MELAGSKDLLEHLPNNIKEINQTRWATGKMDRLTLLRVQGCKPLKRAIKVLIRKAIREFICSSLSLKLLRNLKKTYCEGLSLLSFSQ